MLRPTVLCLALACLAVSTAAAQYAQPQQPPREPVRADGTIKGIKADVLYVAGGQGEQWLVKMPNRPQDVEYNAAADLAWLRPGMWVEFSGTFTSSGEAVSPIGQLLVFTPSDARRPGVTADTGGGGLGALFKPEDAAARTPNQPTATLKVAGRITGLRGDRLTVSAGPTTISAPVAESCRVSVSIADIRYLRPEDTVRIQGWRVPGDLRHIYANQVTINAKEPLSGEPPKPEARPTATRPAPGAANPGAANPGAANPGAANPGAANPGEAKPAADPAAAAAILEALENPAAGDKKE